MKQITIVLLILSITSQVQGQILKSIGLKGGIAIANQEWNFEAIDLTFNTDNRTGFYSSISMEFLKSRYFNLVTDVGYCAKGSTDKVMNTTNDMPEGDGSYKTYDTKFNYLSISPMLKARYETTHLVPYVLAGLRLDYQLSYKSDYNFESIEKDFQKTILGANFEAGIEYKTKSIGVFIEGQYQYDFTKVMDTASSGGNSGIEIDNKAVIICIGLKYYLPKKEDGIG